jgi:hypothetical protein
MLLAETLVKYTVTFENGEKIVTYFTETPTGIFELGKIALDVKFDTSDPMILLQLFVTPHVHNALLEAILPVIENVAQQVDGQLKSNLDSWLLQARGILQPPNS